MKTQEVLVLATALAMASPLKAEESIDVSQKAANYFAAGQAALMLKCIKAVPSEQFGYEGYVFKRQGKEGLLLDVLKEDPDYHFVEYSDVNADGVLDAFTGKEDKSTASELYQRKLKELNKHCAIKLRDSLSPETQQRLKSLNII